MTGSSAKLLNALSKRRTKRSKQKERRAKKKCPLQQGDLMVAIFKAGTYEPLKGVPIKLTGPTSTSATTDRMGIAEFLNLDPGTYSYEADYSGTPHKDDLKVSPRGEFYLGGGSIIVKKSSVSPVSAIIANLKDDTGQDVVEKVTFSILGPVSKSLPEQAGPTSRFEDITVGKYQVSAKVSPPPSEAERKYADSTVSQKGVQAPEGSDGQANLVVPRVNVVTATISLAANEVKMTPPSRDAADPDRDVHLFLPKPASDSSPEVVKMTLSYTETHAAKAFEGVGVLSTDAKVTLWLDEKCTIAFAPTGGPAPVIPYTELKSGKDIWIKGEQAGDVQLQLELDSRRKQHVYIAPATPKTLKIKPTKIITPKIEVEHLIVLRDQELWKHQKKNDTRDGSAAAETKDHIKPDATRIDLFALITPGPGDYQGKGKLAVPANIEVFEDEACVKVFDAAKKIDLEKLSGPKPLSLWMRGKEPGQDKVALEMDPATNPLVMVENKAEGKIGVVELKMKLHWFDKTQSNKAIEPSVESSDTFWTALKDLKLEQKEMTEVDKISPGRLLHVQADENHARAKLTIEKIDDAHWPAGTDKYYLLATGQKSGLVIYDAEIDGNEQAPCKIPYNTAKSSDWEFWLEANEVSKQWRDIKLSLGFDRPDGGPARKAKRYGDWAHITAIQIEEVKLDIETTGDEKVLDGEKFYINLDNTGRELKTAAGKRKIELSAKIKPKLDDIDLYFMVVDHEENYNVTGILDKFAANKVSAFKQTLRAEDRPDPKKLLHHSAKSKDGVAKSDKLKTMQIGGHKFKIGCYFEQDLVQARYIMGHSDLARKKPKLTDNWLVVWRRLFYQMASMRRFDVNGAGAPYADRFDIASLQNKYEDEFITLEKKQDDKIGEYKTAIPGALDWADGELGVAPQRTLNLGLVHSYFKEYLSKTFTFNGGSKIKTFTLNNQIFKDPADQNDWLTSLEITTSGSTYTVNEYASLKQTASRTYKLTIDITPWYDHSLATSGQATADALVANYTIKIVMKPVKSPSGVSQGSATLVCMHSRDEKPQPAESASHTFLHEIGHYIGLGAKLLPDENGSSNPQWYNSPGTGNHCNGLGDHCIMWYQFKMTHTYCPTCKLSARARGLAQPKVDATSAY